MISTQEDLAAENILKRAELARISRQLKSRLSKTNLKIKDKSVTKLSPTKKIISFNSSSPTSSLSSHPIITSTTTFKSDKRKSLESIDLNKTEDELEDDDTTSHQRRQQHRKETLSSSPFNIPNREPLPPSSPSYEGVSIPSTPPQQKIQLNTDIYNTSSTNKTQIHNSSPVSRQTDPSITQTPKRSTQKNSHSQSINILSTPKQNTHDEGADLLMFLATSPSPVQYKQIPSTPSNRSLKFNPSSSVQRLTGQQNSNNMINATPGTPMRNLLKTPGFNMNDYVNFFTPSPAHINRTPDQFSKDVNGKLIKF